MLLATKPAVYERRTSGPHPIGHNSPGISRIVKIVEEETRHHDEEYLDHDDGEWQTTYSLFNHMARVALVMEKIGKARQRSEDDIQLGRIAGQIHDWGKLDPNCQNYRRKKKLTKEERYILTTLHAIYSAKFVESMMERVRPEDRIFLGQLRTLVLHHHDPSQIEDSHLRAIGYDLMIADIFVSIQEDRERPGFGLKTALEFLELLDPSEGNSNHFPHHKLVTESKRVVLWLFGLNLNGEQNPLQPPGA